MTITSTSSKREISDLQRMLLSLGLMKFTDSTQSGKWGAETQEAVVALYDELGWDHAKSGKWITAPALAAMSGLYAARVAEGRIAAAVAAVGGAGSMAGGGGSMAGGGGSMAGGGGSMAGGGGSMAGGAGSMAGGGGSMAGGAGSMAGGGGSMAG